MIRTLEIKSKNKNQSLLHFKRKEKKQRQKKIKEITKVDTPLQESWFWETRERKNKYQPRNQFFHALFIHFSLAAKLPPDTKTNNLETKKRGAGGTEINCRRSLTTPFLSRCIFMFTCSWVTVVAPRDLAGPTDVQPSNQQKITPPPVITQEPKYSTERKTAHHYMLSLCSLPLPSLFST